MDSSQDRPLTAGSGPVARTPEVSSRSGPTPAPARARPRGAYEGLLDQQGRRRALTTAAAALSSPASSGGAEQTLRDVLEPAAGEARTRRDPFQGTITALPLQNSSSRQLRRRKAWEGGHFRLETSLWGGSQATL